MWRMFYRGQFIGFAVHSYGQFTAWYEFGDNYGCTFKLKNKGAAKRWLTEQWLKHNPEAQ